MCGTLSLECRYPMFWNCGIIEQEYSIIATPNPLEPDVILNLNCKLCNEKIPVYADYARQAVKNNNHNK